MQLKYNAANLKLQHYLQHFLNLQHFPFLTKHGCTAYTASGYALFAEKQAVDVKALTDKR